LTLARQDGAAASLGTFRRWLDSGFAGRVENVRHDGCAKAAETAAKCVRMAMVQWLEAEVYREMEKMMNAQAQEW